MGRLSLTENYGENMFMGLSMSLLSKDEAYVTVENAGHSQTYIYSVIEECIEVSNT